MVDVLRRDKFAIRLKQAGVDSSMLVAGFRALATLVEPQVISPTILEDPDDDAVLACAIASAAQAIVSGDSHLLALASYSGIPIMTAAALLT